MGSTCRAVEPWELVAAEVTAAPADRSLASDGEDGELSGFNGGGGLTQLGYRTRHAAVAGGGAGKCRGVSGSPSPGLQ